MYRREFKSQNVHKMLTLKYYYNSPIYPVLSFLIKWKPDYYIDIRYFSNLALARPPLCRSSFLIDCPSLMLKVHK